LPSYPLGAQLAMPLRSMLRAAAGAGQVQGHQAVLFDGAAASSTGRRHRASRPAQLMPLRLQPLRQPSPLLARTHRPAPGAPCPPPPAAAAHTLTW
jgi:hypothetical protein